MMCSSPDLETSPQTKRKAKTRIALMQALERFAEGKSPKLLSVSSLAKESGVTRVTVYRWLEDPSEEEFSLAFARLKSGLHHDNDINTETIEDAFKHIKNDNDRLKAELTCVRKAAEAEKKANAHHVFLLWLKLEKQKEQITKLTTNTIQDNGASVKPIGFQNVIISPDEYLSESGNYVFNDEVSRSNAWAKALKYFKTELARPIPTTVYLTVGISGSGKSTWAQKITAEGLPGKRIIVFDATNLSPTDRERWVTLTRQHEHVTLAAACFPISIEIAFARQTERPRNRQVPQDVICSQQKRLSYPYIESEEGFTEIIAVMPSQK